MKMLSLACLLVVVSGPVWGQDLAHKLAAQAGSQHVTTCPRPNNLTLKDCHDKYPDGCSMSAHPTYDAYLDFLKDQDPDPNSAPTKELVAADFKSLESKLSGLRQHAGRRGGAGGGLTSSNHAAFASQFAGMGEGNLYSVIAYLYFAEDTGNAAAGKSPNSETCNCRLMTPNTFDYHLGIGFDAGLASKAAAHPKPTDAVYSELQKASVVAEMTPYPRTTRHANWTIAHVEALQGKQVKMVGQLMADNDHFNAKDDCGFSGAATTCWRSTIWEMHPLIKVYVCNLSGGCDAKSPGSAWTDLDK